MSFIDLRSDSEEAHRVPTFERVTRAEMVNFEARLRINETRISEMESTIQKLKDENDRLDKFIRDSVIICLDRISECEEKLRSPPIRSPKPAFASPIRAPRVSLEVTEPPKVLRVRNNLWKCPYCNRGAGGDHRTCVFQGFDCDAEKWEKACGIWSPPEAAPPSPAFPSPPTSLPVFTKRRLDFAQEVAKELCEMK